ncbi:hypothetical protein EJ110_NYTH49031 [Nymphaea thermarum]|nr:hypothetical protein EJ110_NYTH49031 [Nymphaea thermarum]
MEKLHTENSFNVLDKWAEETADPQVSGMYNNSSVKILIKYVEEEWDGRSTMSHVVDAVTDSQLHGPLTKKNCRKKFSNPNYLIAYFSNFIFVTYFISHMVSI